MMRIAEVLAVNLVALYGLTRDEWSLATLLIFYWGETLMNTVFVGGRILLHRTLTHKRGHWTVKNQGTLTIRVNGRETTRAAGGTTTLLASFVTTNVLFTLAHGIFVFAFTYGILAPGPSWERVREGLLAIVIAQSVAFVLDVATIRTRPFAWIRRRADAAMGRILVLHLGIIGGAFLLGATNRPPTFFIVFVGLKLLYDLATAVPWNPSLPEKPPGFVRALGKLAKKPGVDEVWKQSIEAERKKQIDDEEPMPVRVVAGSPPTRRP